LSSELEQVSAQHGSLIFRKKQLQAAEADVEEQRALLRANLGLLEDREQQLRHKQAAAAAQLLKLRPFAASDQRKGATRAGDACAVSAVAHIGHARACELVSAAAAPGALKVVRLTVHIKPSEA
jgi:uncharacterized protein (DUF3084 family)